MIRPLEWIFVRYVPCSGGGVRRVNDSERAMLVSKKVIQSLILLVVLGLSVVLAVGVWQANTQKERRDGTMSGSGNNDVSDAEMKLRDMEYTEMQEGRRLWTLRAAEAKYFQDEQKSLLSSVHLTFYFQNGEEAYLESGRGVLYAGTKNIELWDSVQAELPRGYRLRTEKAYYEHGRRMILSNTSVQLSGPEGRVTGGRWEYAISEQKAALDGGVHAELVHWPLGENSKD